MSYVLVLQEEAISDIQESFQWYEERSAGLGYAFLEEVDECLEKLSNHPFFYSSVS